MEETGKVYSDFSRKFNHATVYDQDTDGNIWYFLIPMGVLVGLAVATGDILASVVVALVVCFILYVPRKVLTVDEFMNNTIQGFSDMLPVLTMLLVTFVLKDICGRMFVVAASGDPEVNRHVAELCRQRQIPVKRGG